MSKPSASVIAGCSAASPLLRNKRRILHVKSIDQHAYLKEDTDLSPSMIEAQLIRWQWPLTL